MRAVRRTGLIMLAGALVAASAGCGVLWNEPSPTTTYQSADGEDVVVNWVDYPAEAGVDAAEIVKAPDRDEIEPLVRELMADLRAAIDEAAEVSLASVAPEQEWFADANWHTSSGNGYGGESMLVTLNCCDLQTDTAPPAQRWDAVLAAASNVTEQHGLGPIVLDHDSAAMRAEPAWLAEHEEQYCNGTSDDCWAWFGSAIGNGQWIWLSVMDGTRDATGQAAQDADSFDDPIASVGVSYGATVIDSDRRAEFERALKPFVGLELPEPTASD
ncbi:hypothetical protein ACWPKO_29055 (plasmid) [Coraliomargarita sp. W4R53]